MVGAGRASVCAKDRGKSRVKYFALAETISIRKTTLAAIPEMQTYEHDPKNIQATENVSINP
jgi:hypothetical protein